MRFLLISALFSLAAAPALPQARVPASVALQDVRVIDGTGAAPIEHATIVVRDGKIVSVGKGKAASSGNTIKLTGKTVMPGLINAHGHVGLVKETSVGPENYTGLNIMHQLVQYEQYGVTTVMSLGMNRDLLYKIRKEQGQGNEPGARVLTAGRGIGAPNGAPAVKTAPDQIYRPKTAEEARQAVQAMAAQSPNMIKIWVDDNMGKLPKIAPDIYAAAIDEAHRNNLKVAAHVFYLEDAKRLVNSGVDILAHSVRDKELDPETISLLKSKGTYYIPTLELEESFYIFGEKPEWMNQPFFQRAVTPKLEKFLEDEKSSAAEPHKKAFQIAMDNVRKLKTATVPIGMGTDSGANPYRIAGWAEHRELQLLVQAGLTPLEAIYSATGLNAKLLGLADETGTIAAGKQADLLVLDGDPSTDITNTRKIDMVFHGGRRIKLEAKGQ